MSERIRTWSALVVMALSLGVVAAVLLTGPTPPDERVQYLAERLKCPVCESESIADSPAQVARDSYDLIAERVADGWSNDEILDFFAATYGESVLLDPPASGSTVFLWIAPLVGVAIGGIVLAGRMARSGGKVSDEERRRIQEALEVRR